ncbi:MAG: glycine cleavage system protein GcvH [Clostridiales bacterium]|jgi:glycine cleavage system H protein|nr:glycine cleavage system protein GcvH [Clostridiales bacterium]
MAKELKFSASHEWAELDGKTAVIGVTDYAAELMGDIVFVELPAVGSRIKAGATFANIESVKAVSEVFSPVTGIVTAVNLSLNDSPELINRDAFAAYLIKADVEALEDGLMTESEYNKLKH